MHVSNFEMEVAAVVAVVEEEAAASHISCVVVTEVGRMPSRTR